MIHELKTHPHFFEQLINGNKTCEVRYNDRNYQKNDVLILKEYNQTTKEYSGRCQANKITHVLDDTWDFVKPGYAVLSIRPCSFVEVLREFNKKFKE